MYKRLYFRIAAKSHSISTPGDLTDHHSVLSAMHLLDKDTDAETTAISKVILPIDTKTIIQLEREYSSQGFQWKERILPKIKNLIRELFTNVTRAYPSMGEKDQYRAIYGVDIMFSIESEGIEPKLTEVSFCPANNAICIAYERDENDYKNYNTDIFSCLFLGELPDSIVQLQ
jgi:Tubulin-tyrosine ligase family